MEVRRTVAIAVASASLLAACGGDDSTGGTGEASTSSAPVTPPPSITTPPTVAPTTTVRPPTTKATTTTSPPISREAKLAVARCLDAGSKGPFLLGGFTEEAEEARDLCDEAATQLAIEPGAGADAARSALMLWGITLSAAIVRVGAQNLGQIKAGEEFDATAMQKLDEAFYEMESKVEAALGL